MQRQNHQNVVVNHVHGQFGHVVTGNVVVAYSAPSAAIHPDARKASTKRRLSDGWQRQMSWPTCSVDSMRSPISLEREERIGHPESTLVEKTDVRLAAGELPAAAWAALALHRA